MVNTYQFCTQKFYHMNTRHHLCIWVAKQNQLGDAEALQLKRKIVSHSLQPMEGVWLITHVPNQTLFTGTKQFSRNVPVVKGRSVNYSIFDCLGLFQIFIGCNYCTQSSALSFEKKKNFHQKWVKMTSIQGVQTNKMPFIQKTCPKKCTHVSNVWNRP